MQIADEAGRQVRGDWESGATVLMWVQLNWGLYGPSMKLELQKQNKNVASIRHKKASTAEQDLEAQKIVGLIAIKQDTPVGQGACDITTGIPHFQPPALFARASAVIDRFKLWIVHAASWPSNLWLEPLLASLLLLLLSQQLRTIQRPQREEDIPRKVEP